MVKRGAEKTRWRLYVDESGNFDDPDDRVVVAGVLVRADSELERESTRLGLAEVAPWIVGPLHAAFLRRPGWHAATIATALEGGRWLDVWDGLLPLDAAAVKNAAQEISQTYASHGGWRSLVAAANEGREPDLGTVRAFEKHASAAIGRRPSLGRLAVATMGNVREVVRRLARHDETAPRLVIAVETPALEGVAGARLGMGERYLDLLSVVVERSVDRLLHGGAPAELELNVARRRVRHPQLGVSTMLSPPVLSDLIRRLGAMNVRGGNEGGIVEVHTIGGVVSDPRTTRDSRADAGLQVADLVANSVYGLLWSKSGVALTLADERVETACGLRLRGTLGTSGVGATGWASQATRSARQREQVPQPPAGTRRWVADATLDWCRVFEAGDFRWRLA